MGFNFSNSGEVLWVLIAMAGGIARYLDQYLRGGSAPKLGMLLGNAIVSGFSGYMMVQLVLKFSPDWAVIAAGAGGYMGTQGLDFISGVLRAKFAPPSSIKKETPPEEPKP